MATIVWITGSSSGIGAALAADCPLADTRTVGVSRRASPCDEDLLADLSDPASWATVGAQMREALTGGRAERALLLHCAGTVDPAAPLVEVDAEAYTRAVLLNAASGQVLGAYFVAACAQAGVPGTALLVSSPAARGPAPGLSHYSAGKSALEAWIATIAAEPASSIVRVLGVVPWAVDTPMVRDAVAAARDDVPVTRHLQQRGRAGEFASPADTAAEIWALVASDAPSGTVVDVGAVPVS